jgi:hypothetical protein
MSDPMTNTEVEDVLASIRRLVSDDKRPEAKPIQQPSNDRLVLTPSLRVMDDDASVIAKDDVAEDASDDGTEVEDALVADEPEMDTDVSDTHHIDADKDVEADSPEPQTDHESDQTDTDAIEDEDALSVAQEDAEGEQAGVDELSDDISPDAVEHTPERAPQSLSEKIAALETLVGARNDQFEPDDAGSDAYAGTEPPAMAWEDADDVSPTPPLPDAPSMAEDDDTSAQLFTKDEDVLDEDALRELVSDIVREELQGALGERITRNVRKLVRREIHRALAAQDLE